MKVGSNEGQTGRKTGRQTGRQTCIRVFPEEDSDADQAIRLYGRSLYIHSCIFGPVPGLSIYMDGQRHESFFENNTPLTFKSYTKLVELSTIIHG